jgi:hypothetical protein
VIFLPRFEENDETSHLNPSEDAAMMNLKINITPKSFSRRPLIGDQLMIGHRLMEGRHIS